MWKFLIIFGLLSCQTMGSHAPRTWSTLPDLLAASHESALKSMNSTNPKDKVRYASQGMNWADQCIRFEHAGCYFYRAVNTGLYYEVSPIGYQKGLNQMVRDCLRVLELEPGFENGGAYRILGNIYLKSPSFSFKKGAVLKDLEKAKKYAEKALLVASEDVENRFLMAEVLVEEGNLAEAHAILSSLIYPKKRPTTWYDKTNYKKIERLYRKLPTSP